MRAVSKILFFILIAGIAHAELESTSVLPKGIWSPKFIYGFYTGLTDRYNSSGKVEGVTDPYHIDLSPQKLKGFSPEIAKLVSALNSLSPKDKMGDKLSLGTLDMVAKPSVNYFVPTLSYGLGDKLSVGIGVPIISFRNEVDIVAGGTSNVKEISDHVKNFHPDLDAGLAQALESAKFAPQLVKNYIESQGYKPIRTVEYRAMGDIQLSGQYLYHTSDAVSLAVRPYVVLPTGKKDDPDDLVDQATGGETALGLYSIHDFTPISRVTLGTSAGYQAELPDTASVRVPDEAQFLPGPDRKEDVSRKLGDSTFVEGNIRIVPISEIELGAFYSYSQKESDSYSGSKGRNYGALAKDSNSVIHRISGRVEFSTIDLFKKKAFDIPFLFGYVYANNVAAVNAPTSVTHQLYLRMFF